MSAEEIEDVNKVAPFVAIFYIDLFLKSSIIIQAPSNDLKAIKVTESIEEEDEILGKSLKNSFFRHTWYLAEDVVIVSLADPGVTNEEKFLMIQKLINYPYPEDISYFEIKKPDIRYDLIIKKNTHLHKFVGKNTRYIFFILDFNIQDILFWIFIPASRIFKDFVSNIQYTNDYSEINICLVQDFLADSHIESQRQNIMVVAEENRKRVDKRMKKI